MTDQYSNVTHSTLQHRWVAPRVVTSVVNRLPVHSAELLKQIVFPSVFSEQRLRSKKFVVPHSISFGRLKNSRLVATSKWWRRPTRRGFLYVGNFRRSIKFVEDLRFKNGTGLFPPRRPRSSQWHYLARTVLRRTARDSFVSHANFDRVVRVFRRRTLRSRRVNLLVLARRVGHTGDFSFRGRFRRAQKTVRRRARRPRPSTYGLFFLSLVNRLYRRVVRQAHPARTSTVSRHRAKFNTWSLTHNRRHRRRRTYPLVGSLIRHVVPETSPRVYRRRLPTNSVENVISCPVANLTRRRRRRTRRSVRSGPPRALFKIRKINLRAFKKSYRVLCRLHFQITGRRYRPTKRIAKILRFARRNPRRRYLRYRKVIGLRRFMNTPTPKLRASLFHRYGIDWIRRKRQNRSLLLFGQLTPWLNAFRTNQIKWRYSVSRFKVQDGFNRYAERKLIIAARRHERIRAALGQASHRSATSTAVRGRRAGYMMVAKYRRYRAHRHHQYFYGRTSARRVLKIRVLLGLTRSKRALSLRHERLPTPRLALPLRGRNRVMSEFREDMITLAPFNLPFHPITRQPMWRIPRDTHARRYPITRKLRRRSRPSRRRRQRKPRRKIKFLARVGRAVHRHLLRRRRFNRRPFGLLYGNHAVTSRLRRRYHRRYRVNRVRGGISKKLAKHGSFLVRKFKRFKSLPRYLNLKRRFRRLQRGRFLKFKKRRRRFQRRRRNRRQQNRKFKIRRVVQLGRWRAIRRYTTNRRRRARRFQVTLISRSQRIRRAWSITLRTSLTHVFNLFVRRGQKTVTEKLQRQVFLRYKRRGESVATLCYKLFAGVGVRSVRRGGAVLRLPAVLSVQKSLSLGRRWIKKSTCSSSGNWFVTALNELVDPQRSQKHRQELLLSAFVNRAYL